MSSFISKIKIRIILSCFFTFLGLFFGAITSADLLQQVVTPKNPGTHENIIYFGDNVNTNGNKVFRGSNNSPSVIIRITRFILMLTITLSVTMILYNGMIYIVQTGQGKDAKDLTKNIVYIVIGIFVALFSVVIITLIQSIPSTLNSKELQAQGYVHDQNAGISFKNILGKKK